MPVQPRSFSLSDQLRPGCLGKIGQDAFLHACAERVSSHCLPCLHVHTSVETVGNLRLGEQNAVGGSTGVWRLPETSRAWLPARCQNRSDSGRDWTCRFVPASGIIRLDGGSFPPYLTNSAPCVNIEATPHRDPLADVLNSVAVCGTRFSPKNHAMTVNLNRVNPHRRELLRLRIDTA